MAALMAAVSSAGGGRAGHTFENAHLLPRRKEEGAHDVGEVRRPQVGRGQLQAAPVLPSPLAP